MPNQDLLNYIKVEQNKGTDIKTIKTALLNAGWKQELIDEVFNPNQVTTPPPPPPNNQDSQTNLIPKNNPTMWDAFEHILLFISLYVMSMAIGLTLHFFIDKWFPAVQSNGYDSYYSGLQSTVVNGYLAALIVSTPIFAFLFIAIQKRTIENPQIRNLRARKQLIYLTLVVTFLIMLIQVILTVYSLLNGNISLNFLLHLIINLGITSIIFTYYVFQVKGDRKLNE
jgi:hypothetical protein